MASLLAVTLGPAQGAILHTLDGGIEALTSAGIVARRMTELPDRSRNSGAMLARHLAWRMHDRFGDGAATAVVLAQQMIREARKLMVAGIEPVVLRQGMERASAIANDALAELARPADEPESLVRLASSVTGDAALAGILGEMFDILGADAFIHVEEFTSPGIDREYVEGGYWRARATSREMIPAGLPSALLRDPLVMVSGQRIDTVEQILPALTQLADTPGKPPLLLVAAGVGGRALELINLNNTRGNVAVYATSLQATGMEQFDALQDIALFTGAVVLSAAGAVSPEHITAESFGRVRAAGFGRDGLTLIEGAGHPAAIQQRVSELRSRLGGMEPVDSGWRNLRERIATLEGGIGKLKLGAITKRERDELRERAQRAIKVMTTLMQTGLVPGGGVSYLYAGDRLRCESRTWSVMEERFGAEVIAQALEGPFRQLVRNYGRMDPGSALYESARGGTGFGLDVRSGRIVCMEDTGIQDSLGVLQGALRIATSAATSLLMSEVLVLPEASKREVRVDP
jgi:chaperonin GroEL